MARRDDVLRRGFLAGVAASGGALLAQRNIIGPANAQTNFPQVMPAGTVYGNSNPQSGPGFAVPISSLHSQIISSGATAVPDISALTQLAVSSTVVLVADPLRGGLFVGSGADLSAAVTADPGQAITVAPSAAPSGASGAWVRLYTGPVNAFWFGFINDGQVTLGPPVAALVYNPVRTLFDTTISGGTDNGVAWTNFGQWAAHESSQGRGVWIDFPGGDYIWNMGSLNLCYYSLFGIKKLRITGKDARFTNSYNFNNNLTDPFRGVRSTPWFLVSFPQFNNVGGTTLKYPINNTTVGSKTFTTTTAADAANFSFKEWAQLQSFDLQMNGAPTNPYWNEFVQIASLDAGTGICTTEQDIKYAHRTDYPDFSLSGANLACGKGRIWKLTPVGFVAGVGGLPPWLAQPIWDIDHTYEDIQVNLPPGFSGNPGGGNGNAGHYTTIRGRKFTFINYKGVAFSESICGEVKGRGCRFWTAGETDKTNGPIHYEDSTFELGAGTQSSSNSSMLFTNCGIRGNLETGAKYNRVQGGVVSGTAIELAPTYGVTNSITFDNVELLSYAGAPSTSNPPSVTDNALPMTVDGTLISYANGVFTIPLSTLPFSFTNLIVVPGMHIGVQATSAGFAGDVGFGFVISATQDATNYYITTSLGFSTLPTWASGVIYIFRNGPILFNNCSGSDYTRIASDACANGLQYWNRKSYMFGGPFSTNNQLSGWGGSLTQATINVLQASPTGADVFNISIPTYNSASNFTADSGGTIISINSGVAGKRTITQNEFFGKAGADGITVGGGAVSFLPANRVMSDGVQILTSNPSATNTLIHATFLFDTGATRRIFPTFERRGATGGHQLLATQGYYTP